MQIPEKFLSCDWGTSSFRLRLVETETLAILAEESSDEGNTNTFNLWTETKQPEEKRFAFYLSIIQNHIHQLEQQQRINLNDVPLVISGMASSTIGMLELPYKNIPFLTDGSDLATQIIRPQDNFRHKIILISGVKSEDDVMRGEETQLVGCCFDNSPKGQLFIHPGTHTKHIYIKNGKVLKFKTYMTGEFFSLLSGKSILSSSVEKGGNLKEPDTMRFFEKGVKESLRLNLLHTSFMVRTNMLFQKCSNRENYYYLSGLLTGSELKDLVNSPIETITLAGEEVLLDNYLAALTILGITDKTSVTVKNADEVTIKGQFEVLKNAV
ncbi:2-dehydro-3-deoxygalactonokinase [Rubrolithibacter danxiaensis]|uniref:2-dehydro-3-deoxygalactonokinase n=1 Tax=Rubrolithibacter danxiaensis TaxID=3390805 RepID=UPI003BF84427